MFVDYKEVGRRIAARRKELGLKQSEVNEMAGLSDKYLSNIERATSVMSLDVLMKLCSVLETTPNHLLLGAVTEKSPSEYKDHILCLLERMSPHQLQVAESLLKWIEENNMKLGL